MGLGGIARDSIADLASLVSDDNTPTFHRTTSHTIDLPSSFTSPNKGNGEYLILEEQQEGQEEEGCVVLNDDEGGAVRAESIEGSEESVASDAANDVAAAAAVASGTGYYQFQYEGYQDYYAEDFSYYNQDGSGTEEKKNPFCCFFAPWLAGGDDKEKQPDQNQQQLRQSQVENSKAQVAPCESLNADKSQPQIVNKEQLGQGLRGQTVSPSHAAVTPQKTDETESASPTKEVATTPESTKPSQDSPELTQNDETEVKSILKVKHCSNRNNNSNSKQSSAKDLKLAASPDGKRHLFPTYESRNGDKKKNGEGKDKKLGFIPMARVLTIPSRKDIPLSQKAQVWWQRSDYDDFKKTGRIISKAMECGGSEIWLTSTNAWGKGQQQSSAAAAKDSSKGDSANDEKLVGKEPNMDSEYIKALEKYTGGSKRLETDSSSNNDESNGDFGNKWWCKFGHSRRGLEHIVSSSEGKARQQSVLLAIEMILEEQKRQRIARTKDPNKLRNVALQYTSWARDLALAAGAADNEAVESNFHLAAKSRAHHFAQRSKHLLSNDSKVAGGGVAMAIKSQILDENTHGSSSSSRRHSTMSSSPHGLKDAHLEHNTSDTSLSKRAKGFIPGQNSDVPVTPLSPIKT